MKNKSFDKKTVIKLLITMALCIIVPFTLGWQLELCTVKTEYTLWNAYRWNVVILALIELLIFLVTLSFKWTLIIFSVGMGFIYFANYYVYVFRGRMLTFNDVLAIRTAAKVAGNYSYKPTNHMIVCAIAILAIVVVACICTTHIRKPHIVKFLGLALAIVLSRGGYYFFVESDFLVNQGFENSEGFIPAIHYDGYMVASCLQFREGEIEAPDGYVESENETLLKSFESYDDSVDTSKQPHIILILNESFADLSINGNLDASDKLLKEFYEIEGPSTIRGMANASVLGGGTANTEYEIFTGGSISFLPNTYYPYQTAIGSPKESIVSCLKEAGYTTYSMHPEPSENWNRNHVYPFLGFDYSYWKQDFEGAQTLGNGVADFETYKKIIEIFENRKPGEKQFIFDLTMQNHGGYTWLDVKPSIEFNHADSHDAQIYQSLVEASAHDIKEFLKYFENVDEPVLVLFLGDHQPKFIDTFYDDLYSKTFDATPEENQWKLFKTPYLVWANYDLLGEIPQDISMNYLGSKLLELAKVKRNPYLCYVSKMSELYPVITINGIKDKDGVTTPISQGNEDYDAYKKLYFQYLFTNK